MLFSILLNIVLASLVVFLLVRLHAVPKKTMAALFSLFMASARENRMRWFTTMNRYAPSGGHVFIGDSLIEEYQVTECFPDSAVMNRGIGGDTTKGLLSRLESSVFELAPRQVFVLIGTNDLELSTDDERSIAENIETIVRTISKRLPKCHLHVFKLLPVSLGSAPHIDVKTVGRRHPKRIFQVNAHLDVLLSNTPHVTVHDFTPLLADEQGYLKDAYTREGLHLTPSGYEVLTEAIRPFLK
ncbi:MAG: hypothetical protein EA374_08320 [Acholeplasmatales bacterium]|nr:MAG: hypothetical protein EA374_08320 [Acholeplasmatales bacterium]